MLISTGQQRTARRHLTETALAPGGHHPRQDAFATVVTTELAPLVELMRHGGVLSWSGFSRAWWRIVRQVVLGAAARGDTDLTDNLAALRSDANWAWLRPRRTALRRRLDQTIAGYVDAADPDSLVGHGAQLPGLADQVPHWLFAFYAVGISVMRCLALLSRCSPEQRHNAADLPEYARVPVGDAAAVPHDAAHPEAKRSPRGACRIRHRARHHPARPQCFEPPTR